MFFEDIDQLLYFPVGLWVIQILIILFPTLLYQSYFTKKIQSEKQRKFGIIVIYGISILLCMIFPVSINEGYILDFRYIPLILAFLYGGYQIGLTLMGLVTLIRFLIGGPGFFLTLAICLMLLTIFQFTIQKYENYNPKGKRIYALSLLIITLTSFGFGTQYLDDHMLSAEELILWIVFVALNFITMLTTLYIHESILELEKINFEMIEYEKMHLLSQFSISITHELLNPIQRLYKSVESLKTINLPDNKRVLVEDISDDLDKAKSIINDYLALAKGQENENKVLNVHSEFEIILQSIQYYAQMHDVELKFFPALDKDLYVKGDQYQFRHALLNIIKNGIEAKKEHGVVEIAVHEMMESIYILIEDNGNGMTSTEVNRIGRLVKSKKKTGTGLGTLVACNILKSMAGKVEVTSQIGKGTSFSITLPKAYD